MFCGIIKSKKIKAERKYQMMKEVYVVHGRIRSAEGVWDHDGNYFNESPCVEVFDNFESAKTRFKELVIESYNNVKEYNAGYSIDDSFVKKTTEEDLFSNYNSTPPEWLDEDELEELKASNSKEVRWEKITNDLAWLYEEYGDFIRWYMYSVNNDVFDESEPILPGLTVVKCIVNS